MLLVEFLASLRDPGRVAVLRQTPAPTPELAAQLRALDADERCLFPGLPDLDMNAAIWSTTVLYSACSLYAHRDLGVEEIGRRLDAPCPSSPRAAATHYSVDLTMRHLPDLVLLARGIAPGDPLLAALRRIGAAWPLSSVGMSGLGAVDAAPVCANGALLQHYVDRILLHRDRSRASDPRVAEAIEAAVGDHRELAAAVLPGTQDERDAR
ncbi:MAG: hypothetical protein H6838_00450 [Planctomycetes bacterium]|nr:hypothetical protein [Planctomycetota bacterium]